MIISLQPDDPIVRFPALYNAYPVRNEVAGSSAMLGQRSSPLPHICFIDDAYGRIYDQSVAHCNALYGQSTSMNFYTSFPKREVVDELRVPFRRIPIYSIDSLDDIDECMQMAVAANKSHQILLRGQTKLHRIERTTEENEILYGGPVIEPSFLPSHLRAKFDETLLTSLWHGLTTILINDLCCDIAHINDAAANEMLQDAHRMRHICLFDMLALGIAQHYGLPSVGLDLTDDKYIAAWFALNNIHVEDGKAHAVPADASQDRIVFMFRCPPDAVFEYGKVRPKIFPECRPDRQRAWFGHVGWGHAKNQLGSYLMCGFRLPDSASEELPKGLTQHLFPDATDDGVLHLLQKLRARKCYEGEAKRALDRLYAF